MGIYGGHPDGLRWCRRCGAVENFCECQPCKPHRDSECPECFELLFADGPFD